MIDIIKNESIITLKSDDFKDILSFLNQFNSIDKVEISFNYSLTTSDFYKCIIYLKNR